MSNQSTRLPDGNKGLKNWLSITSLQSYWSRLSYPRKFTLISVIFLLPFLAFIPLVANQTARINQYGSKEIQGLQYLNDLWALKNDLYDLKLASTDFENGTGTISPVVEAQGRVEADIALLKITHDNYKFSLKIRDVSIENITTDWNSLKKAVNERRNADRDTSFDDLIKAINDLIALTGNNSSLVLDPDLDTYYMMDNVLNIMPKDQAIQFQMHEIAQEALANGELTSEQKVELSGLTALLQDDLNGILHNTQIALQNNTSGIMRPLVTPPLQNYYSTTDNYIKLIKDEILNAENIKVTPEELRVAYMDTRQSSGFLYVVNTQTLEIGIQDRIEKISLELFGALLLSVLGISLAFLISSRTSNSISAPLGELITAAERLAGGEYNVRVQTAGQDEIGRVANGFNKMAQEIENSRRELDTHTHDLERRSLELETVARVAREISIIRDLNTLLNVSVNLIRERFKYYHVGIYLVDELNEYAVLRAASSVAAQQLLDEGYKLKIGGSGLVGNVARTGQSYIAADTELDDIHLQNPLLPDTRSEIVLPLRARSTTIGALDIQAVVANAFDANVAQTLQLLADQLAAAIENAQLAQQVETTINELNKTYRTQSQQAWQSALQKNESASYEYDGLQIKAVPQHLPESMLKQLERGKPIVLKDTIKHSHDQTEIQNTLMIPLMVLNQLIGVVGLEQSDPEHIWSEEEIAIAEAAANRAAITLENARLLNDSQKRAIKERAISEASSRIGSALNLENILQITAEEIERVLGGSEVILQIQTQDKE
jgi:GAF domain-containing protein/HAMP domain-containing protein